MNTRHTDEAMIWTLFYSQRRQLWGLSVTMGSFQQITFCADLVHLMKRHDADADLHVEGVR